MKKGLLLKHLKECITAKLENMSWYFYPDRFSSYEDYVIYLKEKGLAFEAPEGMYNKQKIIL